MARIATNITGATDYLSSLFNTDVSSSIRKTQLIRMFKAGALAAAVDWKKNVLPEHFKQPAAKKYRMTRRRPNTMARKFGKALTSKYNSRIYLIWDGTTLESTIWGPSTYKVKQTAEGLEVSIVLKVPKYIRFHKHNIDTWRELTQLSEEDSKRWWGKMIQVVAASIGLRGMRKGNIA